MQTPMNDDQTGPKPKRMMRWLIRLYRVAHVFLLLIVFITAGAIYIAFRPDGLQIVSTYFLEPLDIHYSRAKGSLVEGFTLYDLQTEKVAAKEFSLTYQLNRILQGEHVIDKVTIDGLQIHLDDFVGEDESAWPLPEFKLKEVVLTNLQLISDYPVELDLTGKEGSYDGDHLSFVSLTASLKSRYAGGAIRGSVKNNTLRGIALIYPNRKELDPYIGDLTALPSSQTVRIDELSDTHAKLSTTIDRLGFKPDPLSAARSITLNMDYDYDNDYLDFNALYNLERGSDSIRMQHHLRYAFEGKTTTRFQGAVSTAKILPSYSLQGEFTDDSAGVKGKLTLGSSVLTLASSDYDRFEWQFTADHRDLNFLSSLPAQIRSSSLKGKAEGSYLLKSEKLQGSLRFTHNDASFAGSLDAQNGRYRLDGNLTFPQDSPLWSSWHFRPPEQLSLSLLNEANTTRIHLMGNALSLDASLNPEGVKGSGEYLGTLFGLQGSFTATPTLEITTETPSLFKTLSAIKPIALHKGEYYDAEIHSKTRLILGETLEAHTDITVPWYAAVLDTQRAFGGTDGKISLSYSDKQIVIDRYHFSVADHPITSDNLSRLHFDGKGNLIIDELWVYDSLLLNGAVSLDDFSTSLRLTSERFSYYGPEGEAHMAANITFSRDKDAVQKLEGHLRILDAKVTYLPLQQLKVMDDDIIIIQDVRPPSSTNLSMNLHVTSSRPVHYQTKELDLFLNADVTLWKDPYGPVQLLGMVQVPNGSAKTGGKLFEIQPSEIYFGGDVPMNPYLNLTIRHEVDYKKILIYVTHTLDSPIFLFSSDPVMNQNDIMSYILFGAPAYAAGSSEKGSTAVRADATNFMLGAGLKGLISNTTKIQIDTMNILTTESGAMGFEIGTRLNKDLRVLYKNDTVSSILVQYTLNRWLRLDADVHELGQGINAVYVKDFRDFLPHNPPKK